MRHITLVCCLLLFTAVSGQKTFAQDAGAQQPPKTQSAAPASAGHFYRFDFTVEEVGAEGKPTNSRDYSTVLGTDSHELMSIRTGSRFPIATGPFVASGNENMHIQNNQFQYVDLGVNFDVREVHEIGRQLSLNLTADLSGIAGPNDSVTHQPVIRHNRWQGLVLIPTGKATVVFSSDSLDSKGGTRILVTATPLQ
ncbi:MAG TPA: hypothetical protein VL498_02075 [Terracidiphilus sp.]|jgi:hypothetical protein|nr:hypothetical protein [Terracidiphilus sp.]